MDSLLVNNQVFQLFISESQILARVAQLAQMLQADYAHSKPVFVAVLNGSFMFASDLLKEINFDCEIQFVKVSSYQGTQSTGKIQEIIGLNQSIANRNVIVLEDIIDTGLTMQQLLISINNLHPSSVEVCSLLLKPDAIKVPLNIKYVGFEVGNEFLLGYGLDYDGLGRNLRHLFKLRITD
jgi:hypoxanthine phosphoribosyltransferase